MTGQTNILRLTLTHTSDPNRPMRPGFIWKLALTHTPDTIRPTRWAINNDNKPAYNRTTTVMTHMAPLCVFYGQPTSVYFQSRQVTPDATFRWWKTQQTDGFSCQWSNCRHTFSTARCHWDVFMILVPDKYPDLLTYFFTGKLLSFNINFLVVSVKHDFCISFIEYSWDTPSNAIIHT